MIINCPSCNKSCENDLMTWDNSLYIPFFCPFCEEFNWVEIEGTETIIIGSNDKVQTRIPPIRLGTNVYINNKDHEFFLERGTIVNKDHDFYRVLFVSTDERINNRNIWVPEHWISPIPEDL